MEQGTSRARPSDGPAPRNGLSRNARLGLVLFLIYCIFYGGFVAMNAFAAERMQKPVEALGQINLAVAFGMGLILLAFVLAMIYMMLCQPSQEDEQGGAL